MKHNPTLATSKPFSFGDLEFYSPEEVLLWNACCRVLPSPSSWKEAIQWVFGRMLERPAGHRLTILQTQTIDPVSETQEHTFTKGEIALGRNPDNDVILSANSVSKRHARIIIRDNGCYLEDLGSRMGTFINKKRLNGNIPVCLQEGDQFSLFPYNFSVKFERLWVSEKQLELVSDSWKVCQWDEFTQTGHAGERCFQIDVSGSSASISLRVGERWVETLLDRLLAPLGGTAAHSWLLEPDYGFLEFLLLSVLDRVQLQAYFPFHFSLKPGDGIQKRPTESRGMTNSFTLMLPGVLGVLRVFLPMEFLASTHESIPAGTEYRIPDSITWPFQLSLGQVELAGPELRGLETGDVILLNEVAEFLFPGRGRRGWRGSLERKECWSFSVGNYFERSCRMESRSESETKSLDDGNTQRPDFDQLPVLLHVVLGEKEMSLAEANGLVPGSIIELEVREGEPVDLAINGKRIGKGELVNVEGKLGVKILSWRGAN